MPEEMRFYNEIPSRAFMVALIAVIVGFGSLLFVGGFRNGVSGMGADELGLLACGGVVVAFGLLLARFVFWPRMTLGRQRLSVSRFFGARSWRYDQIEHIGVLEQRIRPKFYGGGGAVHTSLLEITIELLVLKAKHRKTTKLALPHSRDNGELLRRLSLATGLAIERPDADTPWVPKAWFGSPANSKSQGDVANCLSLAEDPTHIETLLNRSRLFAKLGDWDSADQDLYAVREIDADNPDARNNLLCTLYYRMDRETQATA